MNVDLASVVKRAIATLVLLGCVALSACSSTGLVSDSGVDRADVPDRVPSTETMGDGKVVVGLLAGNDGAAILSYLAARLAFSDLQNDPIKLVVRRQSAVGADVSKDALALVEQSAEIVIDATGGGDSLTASRTTAQQGVPMLSVGTNPYQRTGVFGAGWNWRDEAAAVASELARLGYRSVVIIHDGTDWGASFAASVNKVMAAGSGRAQMVAGLSSDAIVRNLRTLANAGGTPPDALVFATTVQSAREVLDASNDMIWYAEVARVGNSSWALSPGVEGLSDAWYAAADGQRLAGFGEKFTKAYGRQPTVRAAITYDLITLAGALPQLVEPAPYASDVLLSPQGFRGVTGSFAFETDGRVRRRFKIYRYE